MSPECAVELTAHSLLLVRGLIVLPSGAMRQADGSHHRKE